MSSEKPTPSRRELLKQSRKARLESFRAFKAKHPLLLSAYGELLCGIRDSNPGSIIFLCGPTGVGKTTILDHTYEYLKETMLDDLAEDRERIPAITCQIVAPTSGSFDWKDYFKRLLTVLEEPLIDHKLEIEHWGGYCPNNFGSSESNLQLISSEKPATRAIRIATERTLKRRRLAAIGRDEAASISIAPNLFAVERLLI